MWKGRTASAGKESQETGALGSLQCEVLRPGASSEGTAYG